MLWTVVIFALISARVGEAASMNPVTEIQQVQVPNEARSEVTVDGSLALQLFEYLLYQYKTKSDSIQNRVARMFTRSFDKEKEHEFDGLAITSAVVLFAIIAARVLPSLTGADTRFFGRKSEGQNFQFDTDKFLQMTGNVLQSIDKFQKKINTYE